MSPLYDALEARDPREREADLLSRLPLQIAHARANAPFYRKAFASVDPQAITSRRALAALPVTRKYDLMALQGAERPFGGLNATPPSALARSVWPGNVPRRWPRRPPFQA